MDFAKFKYRFTIVRHFWKTKKFFNLILNEFEYRLKRTKLLSLPRSLNVELNNFCNLYCPSCPTHIHSSKRKKGTISIKEFAKIVEEVKDRVFNIAVGGNGEITLIPNIEEYIFLASQKGIFVSADTNFNCSFDVVKKLYRAGIGMVNVSLDGVSQKSYGEYRIGGSFAKVMRNLTLLTQIKRKERSFLPIIRWQFIVNKYNENELKKAEKKAGELGVELRTSLPFIPGGDHYFFEDSKGVVRNIARKYLPSDKRYQILEKQALLACYQPFSEMQILCNGDVIPCCRLREKQVILGNIFQSSVKEIWNSNKFVFFRKQLKEQGENPRCAKCLENMQVYL